MASLSVSPSDQPAEHRQGLCPSCLSRRVNIRAKLDVVYEVESVAGSDDIKVLDERLAGSGWDDEDPATCPACGWHGLARDLT